MNILSQIYNALSEDFRDVKVSLYSSGEVSIEIWERNFPIIVDQDKDFCYCETGMTDFELSTEMVEEILKVMKIVDANIEEIKNWTK